MNSIAAIDPPAKDADFVTALARGMRILTCFGVGETELGNGQIARRSGLPPATVARLTHTLTELGYLRNVPHRPKYALSAQVLSIGYPVLAGLPERELARPHLKALADATGGSVCMAVAEGLRAVYIEVSRGIDAGQLPDIGVRRPLLDSSVGRALFVDMDRAEQAAVLNQSCLQQPERAEVLRQGAQQAIDDQARYGMCRTENLVMMGWSAVAMPLRGLGGHRFAVSLGVRSDRVPADDFMRRVGLPLSAAVSRMTSAFQARQRREAGAQIVPAARSAASWSAAMPSNSP
ncbi:MAG: IclR family transcriptional regulator [Burkholderiales bacterium]